MRIEPAIVLAALGSLLPGAAIAFLGDVHAQYGFMVLLMALPFYCFGIACFFMVMQGIRRLFGLYSTHAYVSLSIFAGILLSIVVALDAGWWSVAVLGISLITAALLIPVIQGKRACADT